MSAPPALIVDARAWYGSGIGRVMREITWRLHQSQRFAGTHLVGAPDQLGDWARRHTPGATLLPASAARYSWRSSRDWRRLAAQLPARAVVWFPHWDLPFSGQRWANVVTVHDLIPLLVPGASALRRAGMHWWLARSLRGATRVATPSAATAALLAARFGYANARVIHNGADLAPPPPSAVAVPRQAAPYVLVVANRKPHKGLDVALRSLALLRQEWPALRLAVCGERFAHWGALQQLATDLGLAHAIDDHGVVDDATLHQLYAGAFCLLAPARMEGFGLPVAEALRAGCPVVASRADAHVEVAGHAALLVPVGDAQAMAAAVRALRLDETRRDALVEAGRRRGALFTWDAAADALGALLVEAAAAGRGGA